MGAVILDLPMDSYDLAWVADERHCTYGSLSTWTSDGRQCVCLWTSFTVQLCLLLPPRTACPLLPFCTCASAHRRRGRLVVWLLLPLVWIHCVDMGRHKKLERHTRLHCTRSTLPWWAGLSLSGRAGDPKKFFFPHTDNMDS